MKQRIIHPLLKYLTTHTLLLNIIILIVYIFFGKIGLSFAFLNASATAIWAPTGIALAAILIFGYRVIPAIFIGAFFVNLTTAGTIATSFGIALGNTLEAVVGTYLVRQLANGEHAFDSVSDIFKFTFFAAILGTTVSADIGVITLILGKLVTWNTLMPVWTTWWLGDMGGALVVAPLILVWKNHPQIRITLIGVLRLLLSFFVLLIITEIVFGGIIPYPYLCIPLVVWIAFWFGRRGAAASTIIVALIAIFYTLHGFGPFAKGQSINQSLILLQTFVSIFSLTGLIFATAMRAFKTTEKTLASHEVRFQALIEKSSDAVVLIDATSKISYASPSVKWVLGYNPEELQGKIGFDLVASEDRKMTMRELAKLVLKPGGTVTLQYRTIRKDKKIIWVEAIGTNLLFEPSVSAVVVNFRDITQTKEVQEMLSNSEKRFRALIEKSAEGIALIDKKGEIIYTSPATERLLGYTPEEYMTKDLSNIIHPDDIKRVQASSTGIKKPNSSISLQYRVKHKNGTYRWLDVVGTNLLHDPAVHAIVANFRDITERKQLEEKIRKEKMEDEAMLTSIGDGIIATDNVGKITVINQTACDILHRKEKDLIGKSIISAIPMQDANGKELPIPERPMTKVLSLKKRIITSSDVYYLRKDGTNFPVHVTVTPIILDKKVVGMIEVFQDITKEKEIDKAKSEFVSIASHQLRTPLATINWYLEALMKQQDSFSEKQANYLQTVYLASKRMVNLINALLNASRLELGTFTVEPVSMYFVPIIKQVIEEQQQQIKEKNITIQEHYQEHLPLVTIDPKLFTIIIQNLLSNAIKYSQEKSTIIITVTYANNEFLISVADTGYGIPADQQEKIFTRLFRADNARSIEPDGTGLGLYIVKSIVETTGGKIWFESKEQKGSTFYISFPSSGMQQKTGITQLHS